MRFPLRSFLQTNSRTLAVRARALRVMLALEGPLCMSLPCMPLPAEDVAIANFTAVAESVFAANGGKVHSRLRFAVARESDEAAGPVRKFLGPGHLKDKDGPAAIRLTIIDVTEGLKYQWNEGAPGAISKEEAQAFIDAFLAGTLKSVPVRS